MNDVVLSIGSNCNERDMQVRLCMNWLGDLLINVKKSEVYNTQAINGRDADYLNSVICGECECDLDRLTELLKDYERNCGRTPLSKQAGIVPIDIDIVLWNGKIIRPKDYKQNYFQKGWKEISE